MALPSAASRARALDRSACRQRHRRATCTQRKRSGRSVGDQITARGHHQWRRHAPPPPLGGASSPIHPSSPESACPSECVRPAACPGCHAMPMQCAMPADRIIKPLGDGERADIPGIIRALAPTPHHGSSRPRPRLTPPSALPIRTVCPFCLCLVVSPRPGPFLHSGHEPRRPSTYAPPDDR